MPDHIFKSMNVDSNTSIKWTSLIIVCLILLGIGAALFCSRCKRMLQRRKSRNTVAASPGQLPPENELVSPSFLYSHQSSGNILQCSVCCKTIEVGETVRELPICKHLFHENCITTWLHSNPTCPLCQSNIHIPDERIKGSSSELA